MRLHFLCILLTAFFCGNAQTADTAKLWHEKHRTLRYHPEGKDIVITNGNRRFNRALYGTHTAFRVEAGDLPEFALYMPGMGGNIKLGIISNDTSKWMIDADKITARYRPGSMLYDIEDRILGKGKIHIAVLAFADAEGVVIKLTTENITKKLKLVCVYGGATGKKFSRDGDMGPDPESSFYLKPEYCSDNRYTINNNSFIVGYGGKEQSIKGIFPNDVYCKLVDAAKQSSPVSLLNSAASVTPAIIGEIELKNAQELLFSFSVPEPAKTFQYSDLSGIFNQAEAARRSLADRIQVNTPDAYINTIGGALSIAADAIWEEPSYLHGSIGWRSRLNGWRGAYTGDVLGWHDRARMHFRSYALSQVVAPETGKVIADTALHLTRQLEKMGTSVFSSGYISRNPGGDTRPHHYDMNLVYIDELLWHFRWTGDLAFVKEMWPVIKRHLAWEKRNFDSDDNGLYDAYADIWASDGLQYSGGAGTHSSAYNYRANKMAAELAELIGEDPLPYRNEAAKIVAAINRVLWMKDKGWYAEFKDTMGLKLLHPSAALWTIYHAIDSDVPDAFKAYQSVKYIDNNIPHIPVIANGLAKGYYTLSTSNWMPYTWSLNNVVLAELMHTSLANWQTGRNEEAFTLWKSALLESMYLGGSPGNFQQISTYDAIRGEAYRDFADPVGMTARSMIQGLFGILPDALHNELIIKPGFPSSWKYASLKTPDIAYALKSDGHLDTYTITPSFQKKMRLVLIAKVKGSSIGSILVNDKNVKWENIDSAVGVPMIRIYAGIADKYHIKIVWQGALPDTAIHKAFYAKNEKLVIRFPHATVEAISDPQQLVHHVQMNRHELNASMRYTPGVGTAFVMLKQQQFRWWQPITLRIKEPVEIIVPGKQENHPGSFENVNMNAYFNDKVINIFKNQYLSPRPVTATLQLPVQGIGEWTHPMLTAVINDSGLRKNALNDRFTIPQGITFQTPSDTAKPNILFTSQWDNYPKEAVIPLSGNASHAYILMAGSTNTMQSRITNGLVVFSYQDGTADTLLLKNPENWWPIEQDYYNDGFAFTTGAAIPVRVHLKTGKVIPGDVENEAQYNGKMIEGGAATVLDISLTRRKELKELKLQALANDVVIGLMSITLLR